MVRHQQKESFSLQQMLCGKNGDPVLGFLPVLVVGIRDGDAEF